MATLEPSLFAGHSMTARSICKRILFVDDEPSIRLTLPPVLEENGFEVRVAGTVPDALIEINSYQFDVLLSDLNIGEEGDGFLVVSAMRHLQPNCINLILTGYPAFETALQAIHNQVDDYLVKPADVESLISSMKEKLSLRANRAAASQAPVGPPDNSQLDQRLLQILRKDPRLMALSLSDEERLGQLPKLCSVLISKLKDRTEELSLHDLRLAASHGRHRKKQGYTTTLVIRDFQVVQQLMDDALEANLKGVKAADLIINLRSLQKNLHALLEKSLEAFPEANRTSA